MEQFDQISARIADPAHRARYREVCAWTAGQFPSLKLEFKWNQPMFTHHGTFIISYSASKKHLSVAAERACLARFEAEIAQSGYVCTRELMQIPWTDPVDDALLAQMIAFNIADKATTTTFWRK